MHKSLNFGQIPPLTTESAALEHIKNRCHQFFLVAIDPILFKFACNDEMHNILVSLNFCQIGPPTMEFTLKRPKKFL